MSRKPDDTAEVSPIEWIKLLIITRDFTFDEAFLMADEMYRKQLGYALDRKKVAKAVMRELQREV